jgi:hypothetical protein
MPPERLQGRFSSLIIQQGKLVRVLVPEDEEEYRMTSELLKRVVAADSLLRFAL